MLSANVPDIEQRASGTDGSCKAAYIAKQDKPNAWAKPLVPPPANSDKKPAPVSFAIQNTNCNL